MSTSDRLDTAAQTAADTWRQETKDLSWTGLLVSLALMAAGIVGVTLIHAAVGVPLIVISLVVLYKSGFTPTYHTAGDV